MSDEIVVTGMAELARKFNALDEAVAGLALAQAAKDGALQFLHGAIENISKNGLMRTRVLARSLHIQVAMDGARTAVAEVGTNLEYAAIHEFGGVVTPKSAKYLAIPVGTYKDSPRKHPKLKLRKTAGGNLIMVSPSGQVQYVLKRSVTIKARPYMRPAFDERKTAAQNDVARALTKLVEKAAKE